MQPICVNYALSIKIIIVLRDANFHTSIVDY